METSNPSRSLEQKLLEQVGTQLVTETLLLTNDKVLARITDGIYRAPGSSLRELLSNAYDADATEVAISTDAPRFSRIVVRDNGQGMSLETLAYVVENIGGSSKRTTRGQELNVVSRSDPARTPRGRRIIGKIGIGLFSIAHLSNHFKITTKAAGNTYRAHAEILLAQFDEGAESTDGGKYQQGRVRIWSEEDLNTAAHGTEIAVLNLKPSAVDILRSRETWAQIGTAAETAEPASKGSIAAPTFHIGEYSLDSGNTLDTSAKVPWGASATSSERFSSLVEGVVDLARRKPSDPCDLERILDNYFYTVWMLGLALPFEYVKQSPFALAVADSVGAFLISNGAKGQASALPLDNGNTVAIAAGMTITPPPFPFEVEIDGIRLFRPIDIASLPATANSIKNPQIFVGEFSPDLSRIPESYRGGDLRIFGYFAWAPKVVPNEHQGVLIRINGASGALFDTSFLRYKVAERNRLKQIVAEVFVDVGLDAALNIDRESFNYTHPHYVIVQAWVHNALRQITNQLKVLAKTKQKQRSARQGTQRHIALSEIVDEEWMLAGREDDDTPPHVVFSPPDGTGLVNEADTIALDRSLLLSRISPRVKSTTADARLAELEGDLAAIYQVLNAYRVLDKVSLETQNKLMASIARILDLRGKY